MFELRSKCKTFLAVTVFVAAATTADIAEDDGCKDGSCPSPNTTEEKEPCDLWLGPSPIKEHEEHGFGLGMFTGKDIPQGSFLPHADVLIPVPDWSDEKHPPLREYVWDGTNLAHLTLTTREGMFFFSPGIGAIVPCTSNNYNLEHQWNSNGSIMNTKENSGNVHRSSDSTAGSFAYRQTTNSFKAVRDIVAGEELTIQCSDDDFDGGNYNLSNFHSADSGVVCLDKYVRVAETTGPPGTPGRGRGLFAKNNVPKGTLVTSTPLVPIHRDELNLKLSSIDIEEDFDDVHLLNLRNLQAGHAQLLLNYCYGHPDSDLLLLPYAPLVNYINHPPVVSASSTSITKSANVVMQWHSSPENAKADLSRQQQHHHPELLTESAEKVAITHGKGLTVDIIASRDILEGEEILMDYGSEWTSAWTAHVDNWKKLSSAQVQASKLYVSGADYVSSHQNYEKVRILRTQIEQITDPYPSNLQTACRVSAEWEDPSEDDDAIKDTTYLSWNAYPDHTCILPCIILDRYRNGSTNADDFTYKAKLMHVFGNPDVDWDCQIMPDYTYIYSDIPRDGILLLDRPYTTDTFLDHAFRHEIGAPNGLYPQEWMKKKVRRRADGNDDSNGNSNDAFKRKETRAPLVRKDILLLD